MYGVFLYVELIVLYSLRIQMCNISVRSSSLLVPQILDINLCANNKCKCFRQWRLGFPLVLYSNRCLSYIQCGISYDIF